MLYNILQIGTCTCCLRFSPSDSDIQPLVPSAKSAIGSALQLGKNIHRGNDSIPIRSLEKYWTLQGMQLSCCTAESESRQLFAEQQISTVLLCCIQDNNKNVIMQCFLV